MQKQKIKNPKAGYAKDFIALIDKLQSKLLSSDLKIITNAGGVNPKECRNELLKLFINKKIKIGIIEGDDIYPEINNIRNKGVSFQNLDTGESFEKIENQVCSANVYIDSFSISDALEKGAQIVLAGRVSDPGLVLGPCIHEFNWNKNNYNKLALGTLAGHIVECGAQCTGGNYTGWKSIKSLSRIGYPIIKIKDNGKFIVTKQNNSDGLVSKETISEQILYEMGDPTKYISPDVCVDFTSFDMIDHGNNSVEINSVVGYQPTNTYKVSISYFSGYKASSQLTISGPDAYEKAKLTAEIIWDRLKFAGYTFSNKSTEFLGLSSCHGNINKIPQQINEIVLRLGVKDNNRKKVERFTKEIAPVITSGPPGITGFSEGRAKVQEVIAYWPTLIPKNIVKTKVNVI